MGALNRLRHPLSWSLVLHFFLLLVWTFLIGQRAAIQPDLAQRSSLTWIEVDPITSIEKARQARQEKDRRIVESAQVTPSKEAAPNAFLGKQTQTVDRQTIARQRSEPQQGGARAGARPRSVSPNQVSEGMRSLSRFGIALPKAASRPSPPSVGGETPGPARAGGVPQEYIKGLKEGETTALNTQEFMFYGYYQRIRERLDLAWTGLLREKLARIFKMGRQLASDHEHVTRVLVTMNQGGEIVRVRVLQESGTLDLDDAAVKAFNQAGPFPNPPTGMTDSRGWVEIRWDFVLRT